MTDEDAIQAGIDDALVSWDGAKAQPNRGVQLPRSILADFLSDHDNPREAGYRFLAAHRLIPCHEQQWPMQTVGTVSSLIRKERGREGRWEWWDDAAFGPIDADSDDWHNRWDNRWGCLLPHALFAELARGYGIVYRAAVPYESPLYDPENPDAHVPNSCDFFTRRDADDAVARAFGRLPAETQQHLMECYRCRCGLRSAPAPNPTATPRATSPAS